jgi:ketosteroid isomerase-like protein
MWQSDVELTRIGHEAWSRGDLEQMLARLDKNVEFRPSGVFPGLEPVYRGHEGMRRFWEDFRSPWRSLRIVIHDMRQRGDQVVVLGTFEAVGRDGLTVHRPVANVVTVRNGLGIRVTVHATWEAGLEAVGLSE